MKNRAFILLLFVFAVGNSYGQKYDYNWMAGYYSGIGFDSTYNHYFGISKFNFANTPVSISKDSLNFNFNRSNSIISDKDGNLLFYCNGVRVHNRFDEKIENGDSLSGGYFIYNLDTWALALGILYEQYHLVLPNPLNEDLYDIFHVYMDSFLVSGGLYASGKKVLKSTVDITAKNNHGKIIYKNEPVINQNNSFSLAAVKHGNGIGWWLVSYRTKTSCYDLAYYDGSNVISNYSQCPGGGIEEPEYYVSERFSPDGSLFVTASTSIGLSIFNFERCSGQLSFKQIVQIQELLDSTSWWPTSVEFSPNGRFIYVFCNYRIFQFDLQAADIASSRVTVGVFDPTHECPFRQTFTHAQLAPDGKIYMNGGSNNYCIGVIDNPNGQGASCNFNDMALTLPTFISGLPYYPNYRLGALPGSPCDTLTGLNETARAEKEKILKVFPNPATDYITVDYGFTDWNKGEATLEITNQLGQVVHRQPLPMYSGFQKVEVSQLAIGVYTAFIKRGVQVVATAKFVRE